LIGTIEFARPGALVLLLLPLVVLWFARRAASRPTVDATGTLEIWQRTVPEAPRSAAKPRLPLAVWLLVIALVFGTVALLGPRSSALAATKTLLVVVDRSPSMYLRDGAGTRLEHALALARARIAALGYERTAWIAPPMESDETRAPDQMPSAWLAPPRFQVSEPDLAAFDRAEVLLVTDRAPEKALERAGICASGGAAAPGPIGFDGGFVLVWDGEKLLPGKPAVALGIGVSTGLPESVQRLISAWIHARQLTAEPLSPAANPSDEAVLVIREFQGGPEHDVRLERDGWSAEARSVGPLPARDTYGTLEPWLTSAAGEVVVARASGRVYVALSAIGEPRGDPAAFPVSWAQLLDEALALPPGCVSLAERRAAGAPLTRDPAPPASNEADPNGPWTALAAGIAALFALVAAGLGLSSARGRSVAVP
jgi:hypothetical protein